MKELALNSIGVKTMTLKEITDLLEVRHNDAMATVTRMAESPEFGEIRIHRSSYKNNIGAEIPLDTYQLDKRQSLAVAARLNTNLLMRVVDRWQELELKQASQETIALNDPVALRGLLLNYTEKVIALEEKIATDKPKVKFAENIRASEGCIEIGAFAKMIEWGRNRFFSQLRKDGVLTKKNEPAQRYKEMGVLDIEPIPFKDAKGNDRMGTKTMITGKGQVYFEKKYRLEA